MPEKNKDGEAFEGFEEISIDYENIDVADIMSQIKRRISSQQKSSLQGEYLDRKESSLYPPEFEAAGEARSKIINLLLRVMRPLTPLIKVLILPVYKELAENLARTTERTDRTTERSLRTKEYTKLLHSLTHNIIVELTKLKIEEENLKVKTRIIEKDLELLQKREKALEEKVFK